MIDGKLRSREDKGLIQDHTERGEWRGTTKFHLHNPIKKKIFSDPSWKYLMFCHIKVSLLPKQVLGHLGGRRA